MFYLMSYRLHVSTDIILCVKVRQFLRTDRLATIDQCNESAVAIRLGKLKQQLHEKGIPKNWNEKEVRDSVEKFNLGIQFVLVILLAD